MATIKVHPVQLAYSTKGRVQTCNLCGAEETWTASVPPLVTGDALARTLHMVHLVKSHLSEVQQTFTPAERAKEVSLNVE